LGKEWVAVTSVLSPIVSVPLALPWAWLALIWKERSFCCPPKARVAPVVAMATLAWNARKTRRSAWGNEVIVSVQGSGAIADLRETGR
jgi:hypothetical protein